MAAVPGARSAAGSGAGGVAGATGVSSSASMSSRLMVAVPGARSAAGSGAAGAAGATGASSSASRSSRLMGAGSASVAGGGVIVAAFGLAGAPPRMSSSRASRSPASRSSMFPALLVAAGASSCSRRLSMSDMSGICNCSSGFTGRPPGVGVGWASLGATFSGAA